MLSIIKKMDFEESEVDSIAEFLGYSDQIIDPNFVINEETPQPTMIPNTQSKIDYISEKVDESIAKVLSGASIAKATAQASIDLQNKNKQIEDNIKNRIVTEQD